jgi:hypothetical protein
MFMNSFVRSTAGCDAVPASDGVIAVSRPETLVDAVLTRHIREQARFAE